MRFAIACTLLCVLAITGCQDGNRRPRLALRKEDSSRNDAGAVKLDGVVPPPHISQVATTKVPADFHYQGHTVEEWALALNDPEQDKVRTAAESLRIIGPPGRPYLFQGLDHPRSETRRLCLDNLTISDMRLYGDRGRDMLIKLSGDPYDFRIRKRSSLMIEQWQDAIPARP
jgi:hypothetical protein